MPNHEDIAQALISAKMLFDLWWSEFAAFVAALPPDLFWLGIVAVILAVHFLESRRVRKVRRAEMHGISEEILEALLPHGVVGVRVDRHWRSLRGRGWSNEVTVILSTAEGTLAGRLRGRFGVRDLAWHAVAALMEEREALRAQASSRRRGPEPEPDAGARQAHRPAPPPDARPAAWWEVLGVTPDADADAVKAAYRSLARTRHPDMGGTNDAMAELNDARDQGLDAVR